MTLKTLIDSVSEYLGLAKPIEDSEEVKKLKKEIHSFEKSICFVCYHGVCHSVFYKFGFKEYLNRMGVQNVYLCNSGVEWSDLDDVYLSNSDLVVTVVGGIEKKVRRKLKPKGDVFNLDNFLRNSPNPKEPNWEAKVYELLMQK